MALERYVVVAPNTYCGRTTSWIPRAIYMTLSTLVEQVNADLDVVLDWLEVVARPARIEVLGLAGNMPGGLSARYGLDLSLRFRYPTRR